MEAGDEEPLQVLRLGEGRGVGVLLRPPGVQPFTTPVEETGEETGDRGRRGTVMHFYKRDLAADMDALKAAGVRMLVTLASRREMTFFQLQPAALKKLCEERDMDWVWCPLRGDHLRNYTRPLLRDVAKTVRRAKRAMEGRENPLVVLHGAANLKLTAAVALCLLSVDGVGSCEALRAVEEARGERFNGKQTERIRAFAQAWEKEFGAAFSSSCLGPLDGDLSLGRPAAAVGQEGLRQKLRKQLTRYRPTVVVGNGHKEEAGGVHRWRVFVRRQRNDAVAFRKNGGLAFIKSVTFLRHDTEQEEVLTSPPYAIIGEGQKTFVVDIRITFRSMLRKAPLLLSHELCFNGKGSRREYVIALLEKEESLSGPGSRIGSGLAPEVTSPANVAVNEQGRSQFVQRLKSILKNPFQHSTERLPTSDRVSARISAEAPQERLAGHDRLEAEFVDLLEEKEEKQEQRQEQKEEEGERKEEKEEKEERPTRVGAEEAKEALARRDSAPAAAGVLYSPGGGDGRQEDAFWGAKHAAAKDLRVSSVPLGLTRPSFLLKDQSLPMPEAGSASLRDVLGRVTRKEEEGEEKTGRKAEEEEEEEEEEEDMALVGYSGVGYDEMMRQGGYDVMTLGDGYSGAEEETEGRPRAFHVDERFDIEYEEVQQSDEELTEEAAYEDGQEVSDFCLSVGLPQYAQVLVANEIRLDQLLVCDHRDLTEMGITDHKHRTAIIEATRNLEPEGDVFDEHERKDESGLRSSSSGISGLAGCREIAYAELQLNPKPFASGAFGEVTMGMWRGQEVVVKKLKGFVDERKLREFRREAAVMARVNNHPAIAFFIGVCTKADTMCLIFQYYSRQSAYDILVKDSRKADYMLVLTVAMDAASGLMHLHKEHYVHCDVAARNILVTNDGRGRVSDFGMSRVRKAVANVPKQDGEGPVRWMAPELLRGGSYTYATDVFAFGVTLYEMVAGKKPWYHLEAVMWREEEDKRTNAFRVRQEVKRRVVGGEQLPIPDGSPDMFGKLMLECTRYEPEDRPTFPVIWRRLHDYYCKVSSIDTSAPIGPEVRDPE